MAVPFEFSHLEKQTSENRIQYRDGGKYGCLDSTGKICIPPKYDWIGLFSENRASAESNHKEIIIDRNGTEIFAVDWHLINHYQCGRAYIKTEEGLYGFVDKLGNVVVEPQFEYPCFFYDGFAAVCRDHQVTVIDVDGQPQFDWRNYDLWSSHQDGIIIVIDTSKKLQSQLIISVKGNVLAVLADEHKLAGTPSCGRIRVKNKHGLYGYVDYLGSLIIDCQFDDAQNYCGGLARVTVKHRGHERYGYIDTQGEFVIPPDYVDYEVVGEFDQEAIWLRHFDGRSQLMNRSGRVIWEYPAGAWRE